MQTLKFTLTALGLSLLMLGCKSSAPNVASNSSPTGHGAEVMRSQCLTCHGDDLISSQRLSKTGWTREVEKMMRWGAEVADADKEHLIEYLAATYPQRSFSKLPPATPEPMPDAASVARGKTVFEAKCLTCHGDDIIGSQRLTRTGWTREVEKMTRWGAEVSDEEKAPLVDYLIATYTLKKK